MRHNMTYHVTDYTLISLGLRNHSSSYPINFWTEVLGMASDFLPCCLTRLTIGLQQQSIHSTKSMLSFLFRLQELQTCRRSCRCSKALRWHCAVCSVLGESMHVYRRVDGMWRVNWIHGLNGFVHWSVGGLMDGPFKYRESPMYYRPAGRARVPCNGEYPFSTKSLGFSIQHNTSRNDCALTMVWVKMCIYEGIFIHWCFISSRHGPCILVSAVHIFSYSPLLETHIMFIA
jgi:hypothetical protein